MRHATHPMSPVRVSIALLLGTLVLWGCSQQPQFVAKEEPWRDEDERACLAAGVVRESSFVSARSALGGPSVCGALRPFAVAATAQGEVQLRPAALLRCPMLPAVDFWAQRVVMPAARQHFGMAVVEVKVAASYSCRPMNNVDGAMLSEHGHANAIDVSGFVLANGTTVSVKTGWWGAFAERNFLRAVRQGSCRVFTTVLGPGYDVNHRDHFHLDLAHHGRDGAGRICK
jgi:hypothetical protein